MSVNINFQKLHFRFLFRDEIETPEQHDERLEAARNAWANKPEAEKKARGAKIAANAKIKILAENEDETKNRKKKEAIKQKDYRSAP